MNGKFLILFSLDGNDYCFESPFFTVADVSWSLNLYPCLIQRSDIVDFCFTCKGKQDRNCSIEYYLGLKKCDGNIKQFASGILDKDTNISDTIDLIEKAKLIQLKTELVPENILTIICTMKLMTDSHSTQPTNDKINLLKLISKL